MYGRGVVRRFRRRIGLLAAHDDDALHVQLEGAASRRRHGHGEGVIAGGAHVDDEAAPVAGVELATQIADMEIKLNGKGVVGDAIRRPTILYRLLLGLLPF